MFLLAFLCICLFKLIFLNTDDCVQYYKQGFSKALCNGTTVSLFPLIVVSLLHPSRLELPALPRWFVVILQLVNTPKS